MNALEHIHHHHHTVHPGSYVGAAGAVMRA